MDFLPIIAGLAALFLLGFWVYNNKKKLPKTASGKRKAKYSIKCVEALSVPNGGKEQFYAFLSVIGNLKSEYSVHGKLWATSSAPACVSVTPATPTETPVGNGPAFTEPHVEFEVTALRPGTAMIEVNGISNGKKTEQKHEKAVVKVTVV